MQVVACQIPGNSMNQIPAYSDPRDATTGAVLANQVGSWRRNQLRLEAGAVLPNNRNHI